MPGKTIACLFLILWATSASATTGDTRLPLRLLDGLPVVAVSVDDSPPRWFVVDTGTGATTVSERLATELGLTATAISEIESTTGRVKVVQRRIRSLRLGTVELGGGEVVSLDRLGGLKHVDGVLGFDWLSRVNFLLDYGHRVLVLDPAATLNATLRGEHTPFARSMGRPVVDVLVQVQNDPEGSRRLVVDSGATTAVLLDRPRNAATPVRLATLAGSGAAQSSRMSVTLAGTTLASTPVVIVPPLAGATREDQGLLPASLFAWMYFDVARGEMVWKRAA